MTRFLTSVSCLLTCLVMACAAEPPSDPKSLGEAQQELSGDPNCTYECFDDICRRPGAYGRYILGVIDGNNCVANGISVSCDASGVECPYCTWVC